MGNIIEKNKDLFNKLEQKIKRKLKDYKNLENIYIFYYRCDMYDEYIGNFKELSIDEIFKELSENLIFYLEDERTQGVGGARYYLVEKINDDFNKPHEDIKITCLLDCDFYYCRNEKIYRKKFYSEYEEELTYIHYLDNSNIQEKEYEYIGNLLTDFNINSTYDIIEMKYFNPGLDDEVDFITTLIDIAMLKISIYEEVKDYQNVKEKIDQLNENIQWLLDKKREKDIPWKKKRI